MKMILHARIANLLLPKKKNRGSTPIDHDKSIQPGSYLMCDVQENPSSIGITKGSHHRWYLQITDAKSRFTVFYGINDKSSYSVFKALLLDYSVYYCSSPTFYCWRITNVQADFASYFTSDDLHEDCNLHNIKVSFAAPRHKK